MDKAKKSSADAVTRKLKKALLKATRKVAQSSEASKGTKRAPHPNSLRNLKPFKPGQSGNPGGKPKTDLAKEIAQAIFTNDAEAIYRAYAKALRSGNVGAFAVLADRAFGKLKEQHEHTGPEGGAIAHTIRFGDGITEKS